jgi:glycosyltransferase involved in cell wall biosynthesis
MKTESTVRVLYLSQNPSVVGTTRILREWLIGGRDLGVEGAVCVPAIGSISKWASDNDFRCVVNQMRWPDRLRPWRAIGDGIKLRRWIRREGVTIIQCNEHQIYPFAALLGRLAKLPVVCHVRSKLTKGFAAWSFGKREPDALIWCTKHMASECQAALAGTVSEERQHVIPLGMSLPQNGDYLPARERNHTVVGMAAFIRPGKRIEEFLELARRFRGRTGVSFALAGGPAKGDEDYFASLRPQIQEAVSDGLLVWKGHIDPVESFLQTIDVFVSTSEHESFGMSVCEAMACGKPVAGYVGGSVAEVVGDTGLIVETGDIDGLTAAVERLVVDSELRRELGEKARRRVATEFNPANSLKQLEEIYRSLLIGKK